MKLKGIRLYTVC